MGQKVEVSEWGKPAYMAFPKRSVGFRWKEGPGDISACFRAHLEHTHIHTYTYIYMYMYVYVCVCSHVHTHARTCVCVYIYIEREREFNAHVHVCSLHHDLARQFQSNRRTKTPKLLREENGWLSKLWSRFGYL